MVTITEKTGGYFEFKIDSDIIAYNKRNDVLFDATLGFAHFKTSEGANIIKKQNVPLSEITIIDAIGTIYNPTTVEQLFGQLTEINYFAWIYGSGGGGTGVNRFNELLDTFGYVGNNGKVGVVNEDLLRLDPVTLYNYRYLTDLEDVSISPLSEEMQGKFLSVGVVGGQMRIIIVDAPNVSQQLPNELLSYTEPNRVGDVFTFPAGTVTARINGIELVNVSEGVIEINPATVGFNRIDKVVFTSSGTFLKIVGVESELTPQEPTTPVNTIELFTVNVSGLTVEDPSEPIIGNEYVTKVSQGISYSDDEGDIVLSFFENGKNKYLINSATSVRGFDLVPFGNIWEGKSFFIVNMTGGNLTLYHLADDTIPFFFPSGSAMSLLERATAEFNYINGQMNYVGVEFGTGGGGAVDSVNGQTGVVVLDASDVGAEPSANKQNALTADGTGTKFPTVDATNSGLALKQDILVSGTNIKTLIGESLLGSGNLDIARLVSSLSLGQQIYFHVGQPGALLNNIGVALTVTGTSDPSGTGPTYGGSTFSRMIRSRYASASTAGSSVVFTNTSFRILDNQTTTSFFCSIRFGNEDALPVSDARLSIGFGTDPLNSNPSATSTIFCLGNDIGDTNLSIISGSGVPVKTDLGINFPSNTNSLDNYLFEYWKEKGSSEIFYRVYNYHNGAIATGSTSNVPAPVGYFIFIRRNNGTTALPVKLSLNHHLLIINQ